MPTTPKGTPYVEVNTTVAGDPVRAHIPARTGTIPVVYCIHSHGGDHNQLDTVFGYPARLLIDAGFAVVVPKLGGSLWSSPTAQKHLVNHDTAAQAYAASRGRTLGARFLLGVSHGGALTHYAAARNLIPLRGVYTLNGVYDLEADLGQRLAALPAFGWSLTALRTHNPARQPVGGFPRVRVSYSDTDTIVPPARHSQLLAGRLTAAGLPVTTRAHDSGHGTPPGFAADVVHTFRSWL